MLKKVITYTLKNDEYTHVKEFKTDIYRFKGKVVFDYMKRIPNLDLIDSIDTYALYKIVTFTKDDETKIEKFDTNIYKNNKLIFDFLTENYNFDFIESIENEYVKI